MAVKFNIKNRKGQKLVVLVDEAANAKGLAFAMHGLGGFKEQAQLETFAGAFREKGFTVVRFDATNTLGESDGDMADATLTNYYEDLEDVIKWTESQAWYSEPFFLAGHSLGGISVALFAERFPEKVKGLAPISTVVSGPLTEESLDFKEIADDWKKKGIREWESGSQPGVIKRLKWSHNEDRRRYDLLPRADRLTMPVLLIVGEFDKVTPLDHQKLLFDALPGEKELHIIKGAEHTFKALEHLEEIRKIITSWINKITT